MNTAEKPNESGAHELSDKELEHIAGGTAYVDTCPQCGSEDYRWRGEARACICGNCGYTD